MKTRLAALALLILPAVSSGHAIAAECQSQRVKLQMLGVRGPEFLDDQASTSYLIWLDDKARVLIDTGPGSMQNFKRSSADFSDVRAILYSHFHVDHSLDFPGYIKASYFTTRDNDLIVTGPAGNRFMPSAEQFLQREIGDRGSYAYLSDFVDPALPSAYKVRAKTLAWSADKPATELAWRDKDFRVTAVPVHHGPIPALAYRVETAGCAIVFSGDMNGDFDTLPKLAKHADILVAHNAIPEDAEGVAAFLHMKPSYIGEVAARAGVKKLLLTHLMARSVNRREEAARLIHAHYPYPVRFPKDLDVIRP